MPTYQYACTACEHRLEAVQSFSDAALTDCPECQGRLRKVFSSVGIVFKGSGFYRTDSRNGNGKPSGEAATSETKSETKAETKAEAKASDGSSSGSSSGGEGKASSNGGSSSSKPASTAA